MDTPHKAIMLRCPECGHLFEEYISSVNVSIKDFGEEYQNLSHYATCPVCSRRIEKKNTLIGKDGIYYIPDNEEKKEE